MLFGRSPFRKPNEIVLYRGGARAHFEREAKRKRIVEEYQEFVELPARSGDPRQIATAILQQPDTPLELMVDTMHAFKHEQEEARNTWETRACEAHPDTFLAKLAYFQAAMQTFAIAKEVAPYLHPKLSSTELWIDGNVTNDVQVTLNSVEELKAMVRGQKTVEKEKDDQTNSGS
jgi:hypothetical protein